MPFGSPFISEFRRELSVNDAVAVILVGAMTLLSGCISTPTPPPSSEEFSLVFQSGFEPDSYHVFDDSIGAPCSDDIRGNDTSNLLGDWENDLEGDFIVQSMFCFGGGDRTQRGIDLVTDSEVSDNQVLHMWIIDPAENISDSDDIPCNGEGWNERKARVQHVLKGLDGVFGFHYEVRLKLGHSFTNLSESEFEFNWMTIGEFWNNLPAEDYSFRVTLNLIKPDNQSGTPFFFGIKGESQEDGSSEWVSVWEDAIVTQEVVPIGEWFTLDVTLLEGDQSNGEVILGITRDGERREFVNLTDWTYHPDDPDPDGFSTLNTMKLYTSGGVMCGLNSEDLVLEAWWDDFRFEVMDT